MAVTRHLALWGACALSVTVTASAYEGLGAKFQDTPRVMPGLNRLIDAAPELRPFCRNSSACLPRVFIVGASKSASSSLHFQVAGARSVAALCGIHYQGDVDATDVISNTSLRVQHCTGLRGGAHGAERHLYDSNGTFRGATHALHVERRDAPKLKSHVGAVLRYTPHYLWSLGTAGRLLAAYQHPAASLGGPALSPLLKFVVIIREPVARAISSYWFKNGEQAIDGPRKPAGTRGSVEHAMRVFELEMDLLRPCLPPAGCFPSHHSERVRCANDFDSCLTRRSSTLGKSYPHSHLAHIGKGMYAAQLLRWFVAFSPHQFHVLPMERMYFHGTAETFACYLELFAFLGLTPHLSEVEMSALIQQTPSNPTHNPSRRDFNVQQQKALARFFETANLHLAALLGSDEVLSWWPGHSDDAGHTAPSPSSPSGQGEAGVETRSGDLHGDLQ